MEDRETARICKYGESKTTRIMMANVPHATSGLGLRKFQTDGFLLKRVYLSITYGTPFCVIRVRRTDRQTDTQTEKHVAFVTIGQ